MRMTNLPLLAATALCAWAPVVLAQEAIVIGASLPLSGPNAGAGQEGLAVAKAYFDSLNKAGGINGRKLVLNALDDAFNPQQAADNTRKLINDKAVAIFNCWGTASCSAMMPVIQQAGVPMVSGISGGGPMRQTPGQYAFNVRPTTEAEIQRMVSQMSTLGQKAMALVVQNDAFGKSGQVAAAPVFQRAGIKPVAELTLERDGANAEAVVESLKQLPALNGIILVAAPPATVRLIPAARKAGLPTQFYNLAAQANRKLAADLGENTSGVVFTTLVPSPWKTAIPVVQEYQQLVSAATGQQNYSYLGLEVYINARVLVEGLRRAGRTVTREALVSALETMGERQFGPMTVRYGPNDHEGSSYVGLTIINRDGRFVE